MTSTDLIAVLENWLNNGTALLQLEIDEGAVVMMRHACGVACRAMIPLPAPPDDRVLERALQLAEVARDQFHEETAMLSMSPEDGQLWLWMRHDPDDVFQLCRTLETLLNQRDVWVGLLSPPTRSTTSASLNLNTLAFWQGEHHA
ncbi:type III secretion system chaperone [Brenneria rubrifaciens]|uniref:Type III secretion protein n=1 Tax=Brenneria rubrifaciens TaxID=55213 RepID=A0A4P8QNE2_9GAMM|nr:type III secretion system chaperone [Brenneria rubrifaciens]QCR08547.1 type III secretion protein [Brenneria rubrifaciens]